MPPCRDVAAEMIDQIHAHAAQIRRPLSGDIWPLLSRKGRLPLARPGIFSPNRHCRLIRAADGWIAVNLAREDDRALLPAWLHEEVPQDLWRQIVRRVRGVAAADWLERASLLGLPVAIVGETRANDVDPLLIRMASGGGDDGRPMRVVDLSCLWAGPLCGAILAMTGASVVKIEDTNRPDMARVSTPSLYEGLNRAKLQRTLDFRMASCRRQLMELIVAADILITNARPRAFVALGLVPELIFDANPQLTWVAVTGYGWKGPGSQRVAFGDDAAAAGGLVRWCRCTDGGSAPQFMGDALADPLTGLAAAMGALRTFGRGGGGIVDAALARTAAGSVTRQLEIGA
jgi:hypothetical protein